MVIKVKDEMNRNVKTLGPDNTVKEASEKMSKYWMGSIVIVDGNNIVGILTERDILSKIVAKGKNAAKTKIKHVMSAKVITIEEDKEIADAIRLMKANDIKKLPVTKNGVLSGILTTTDLITGLEDNVSDKEIRLQSYRDLKILVRRHAIDLKREMKKNQILTFVIPNALYPADSLSIVKAAVDVVPQCIFVTVNKPHFSIIETLKKNGINPAGLYFIDASTEGSETGKDENYEMIKSPADITEIMLSVEKAMQKKQFFGLIFDSVSTLLAYQPEELVSRFTHSLVNKLRKHNVKGIFLCMKEDMKTSMLKNLNMLADYSVDIEKKGDILD